jgi:hypothetical protein
MRVTFRGLEDNLTILRKLPFIISLQAEPQRNSVDALNMVLALRMLTRALGKPHSHHIHLSGPDNDPVIYHSMDSVGCDNCRGFSGFMLAYVSAHVSTVQPAEDEAKEKSVFPTSLRSIGVATAFYLNSVVRKQSVNDMRIYSRLVATLVRDISETSATMTTVDGEGRLWFWKVFVGAHAVVTKLEERGVKSYQSHYLDQVRKWLFGCVRKWATVHGVSTWEEARSALYEVVWPSPSAGVQYDSPACLVWKQALMGASAGSN